MTIAKTDLTSTTWVAIDSALDVAGLANIHCPLPSSGCEYFVAADLLVAGALPEDTDIPSVQLLAGETMLTSVIAEVWPDGGALYGRLSAGSIEASIVVEELAV